MGFKKGQSGNPGGRPKELKGVQELARRHGPAAVAVLARIVKEGKSDAARIAAATALLDRGFGKPVQATELTGKDGGPLTLEQLIMQSMSNVGADSVALPTRPDADGMAVNGKDKAED